MCVTNEYGINIMTEENKKDIDELIARYLAGTATPQEEAALQGWLAADTRHRTELEQLQHIWQTSEKIRDLARPDLDREWDALRRRLHDRPQRQPALRVLHRKRHATLLMRIAAVLVVGLFAAALIHMITGPLSHKVYTATAGTEIVTLPDGTLIHLDRGSRLVTPRRFGRHSREVSLSGVAWFEVAHDASRPFTVHAGDVDVTVLGTKFSIRADNDEQTVVDLVEGRVKVSAARDGRVILSPGEEACWDREKKQLIKTTVTDPNFLAWKTRQLIFNATPLQAVLGTLEKTYHVHFITGNRPLNCRVTASFDNEPLKNVLSTLSEILDISFESGKEGYTIAGPGCRE